MMLFETLITLFIGFSTLNSMANPPFLPPLPDKNFVQKSQHTPTSHHQLVAYPHEEPSSQNSLAHEESTSQSSLVALNAQFADTDNEISRPPTPQLSPTSPQEYTPRLAPLTIEVRNKNLFRITLQAEYAQSRRRAGFQPAHPYVYNYVAGFKSATIQLARQHKNGRLKQLVGINFFMMKRIP